MTLEFISHDKHSRWIRALAIFIREKVIMKNRTKLISLWGIGPTFIFSTAFRDALG